MDNSNIETTEESPRYCSLCCRVLGNRNYEETWEKWRCNAEENLTGINVVNGMKTFKVPLCKDQRDHALKEGENLCGLEGRWFKLYVKPDFYRAKEEADDNEEEKEEFAPVKTKKKQISVEDLI